MGNTKNLVMLRGNLGDKPQKFTSNGKSYSRFSIAINNYRRNKENGEIEKTSTDWISVTAFDSPNKLADRVMSLEKGNSVQVQGRLSAGSYEKDGETKYSLSVIAEDIQLIRPLDNANLSNALHAMDEAVAAAENLAPNMSEQVGM